MKPHGRYGKNNNCLNWIVVFKISLNNNKVYTCRSDQTILEGATFAGLNLNYSCNSARCRTCIGKLVSGNVEQVQKDLVLTDSEREQGCILTCNAKPTSDLVIETEELGNFNLPIQIITPAKVTSIEFLSEQICKLVLRTPPKSNIDFLAGQHVNIIKGSVKRSYSIANANRGDNTLDFYIKNYENGIMSDYFFNSCKVNDLLRLQLPLGTFFYRKSHLENIVFLATGTGIAPVKSMLDEFDNSPELVSSKKIWLFWGGRTPEDFFWKPNYKNIMVNYQPVLSRKNSNWKGHFGYVQDVVLSSEIKLENTQVYACGSNEMIQSSNDILTEKGLSSSEFYSDAFLSTT